MAETTYCDDCKEDIVNRNWKRHLNTNKHKNNAAGIVRTEPEKYLCEWPGCEDTKAFSSRTSLANHTKRHKEGPKPIVYSFTCETCGIELRDQSHLSQHLKTRGHEKEIIQNHPEYLAVVPESNVKMRKIDPQKKRLMIKNAKKIVNKRKPRKEKPVKEESVEEESIEEKPLEEEAKYVPISQEQFDYDNFVSCDFHKFTDDEYVLHQLELDKCLRYLIHIGNTWKFIYENGMDFEKQRKMFDDGLMSLEEKKEFQLEMMGCLEEAHQALEEEEANELSQSCHPIDFEKD